MGALFAAGATITGISLLAAVAGRRAARAEKAAQSPGVAPENLITQILFALQQKRKGDAESFERVRAAAADTAAALGLDLTAAALRDRTPLPTAENWPGTNISVRAFVAEKRQEAGV